MDMRREVIEELKTRYELAAFFAKAVIEELGEERAMEIIRKGFEAYHADLMEKDKKALGGNSWEHWKKRLSAPSDRRATDLTVVEADDEAIKVRVTDCLHLEAFRELGVPRVCRAYCESDYSAARGFNEKMYMTREHTLAHGDDYCDHVWHYEKE